MTNGPVVDVTGLGRPRSANVAQRLGGGVHAVGVVYLGRMRFTERAESLPFAPGESDVGSDLVKN